MEPAFWHRKWQVKDIGFHEAAPHRRLVAHWPLPAGSGTVLVPLCGKSNDMGWLHERGHRVIGIELSEIAVREFFAERGLEPVIAHHGAFSCYRAEGFALWCGDFFATTRALLGKFDAIYDRAALIALPPAMRARYVQHLCGLCAGGERGLLITIEYAGGVLQSPPHSVGAEEVHALYSPWCARLDRVGAGPTEVRGVACEETVWDFAAAPREGRHPA